MGKVIVMASGGVESNTLIAKLTKEGNFVVGLFFDIGLASNDQMLHCAKNALNSERGRLEHVNIRGMRNMFLEFIPPELLAGEADKICPDVEFIPIYASIATYYAEASGIKSIYLGFTRDQMDRRRSKFLRDIGPTFASYQEGLDAVSYETPFAKLNKADVVAMGKKLGVDYRRTWSCMHGGAAQCGECERCKSRKKAFLIAKVSDPTAYLA